MLLASSSTAMSGEGVYNYGLVIFLMMTGLYLVLAKGNMIKSVIGLNLFQVSVIMFYVSMGRVEHGTAPILLESDLPHHEEAHDNGHGDSNEHGRLQIGSDTYLASATGAHTGGAAKATDSDSDLNNPSLHKIDGKTVYSNPLPHVLMLTAIVVGVATTALALSLVVRIREYYGTIEEDLVDEIEEKLQKEEVAS
jgi:multicomponent Na+:H+ antiporter subunit C